MDPNDERKPLSSSLSAFDIIAFVLNWRFVFIACTTLGLGVAVCFVFFNKRIYEHDIVLEALSQNHPVTKTPETVKRAVISLFSKPNLCKIFSDNFFETLTKLSAQNDELGAQAKLSLQEFRERFSSSPDHKDLDSMKRGFVAYLNTDLVKYIKEEMKPPKAGFLFLLTNLDNTSWKLFLRSAKDTVSPIARATVAGLQAMTPVYNEQEMQRIQNNNEKELELIQKKLTQTQDGFLKFQETYGEEKTQLQIDFYRLAIEIQEFYIHNVNSKVGGRGPLLWKGSLDNALISVTQEQGVKEINTEIMVKTLAEISEKKGVDDAIIGQFVKKIANVEAKKAGLLLKNDLFNANLRTCRELYSKALATSVALPNHEDFALPSAMLDEANLMQQAQALASTGGRYFLLVAAIGLCLGLLLAAIIATLLECRQLIKSSVKSSRFFDSRRDRIVEGHS